MEQFDVIVVGAGLGGASCGALLAQGGKRVLLLEQNPNAGGKGMTLQRNGYTYAAWVVVSAPAVDSMHERLLRRLGLTERVQLVSMGASDSLYQSSQGAFRLMPRGDGSSLDPTVLLDWLEVPAEQRMAVMGTIMSLLSLTPAQIDALEGMSFAQWLAPQALPPAVHAFLVSLMCDLMYMVPVDTLCAAEAIHGLQSMFQRGGGLFCVGGFGAMAEALCQKVRECGGEVRMGCKVEQLIVEAGRVVGVRTEQGDFRGSAVVSNVGIQPTALKLLAEEPLAAPLREKVRQLKPSIGMMGTRYFLREPLVDVPYGVIFSAESPWTQARFEAACAGRESKRGVIFFEAPSVYDPAAAPDGRQVLLTGYWCPADPNLDEAELAQWREAHEAVMWAAYPRLESLIDDREFYTARDVSRLTRDTVMTGQGGECIGLGQTVGQCGSGKPSIDSGIPGLYFVGCDAGGRGVGTQQAVASGMAVAEHLMDYPCRIPV
ncbi:phytoene desaturase family protein [Denitratisoma oestradiolicum]|uniref:Putative Similar to phytoene dehydrogenase n=1 Tax=Denitratisoma oestradiolicum TaxID=311182 RepID=A0A6S6XWI1_9PROT|nr:NAD(P)/FAD-dependent oxidoreductase [Denitratisoma oestradiolicum]TWO81405.1 hypothetical protein CBW56_04655 [Denitratisoma oestradiolicum]CAB1368603.1 putative Similar to phytoene dehydrogenase [Denitratisoma oestradiolicum]